MPIISVNNLEKTYRIRGNKKIISGLFKPDWQYKYAVERISFTIDKGEAVAFLGPNGAGKTTTTKMLTGLIFPTGGDITVLGYTPFDRDYAFLRRIGLVMGNRAGLNWDLSARQSFDLLRRIYDIPEEKAVRRVNELTAMLTVQDVLDTQVRRLSLGERMKLELIGAILHDPDILFLDEPTIGLDITSKNTVRDFLRHLHKKEGKTLLLTSHDMDDIAGVCERVVVINHGRIMYDDTMQSLNRQYANIRYARMEFAKKIPDRQYLQKLGKLVSLTDSAAVLGVSKSNVMKTASRISETYPLQDITIEQVPLEVIISDLYSGKK